MSKPKKISVLIADDHGMLRDSLRDVLNDQKDLEVVGCAVNGEECVRLAKQIEPDVILMDIKMPGISGLEATKRIKSESTDVKILIISTYEDELHILDAFRSGADGYLPKTSPAVKMIEAVRRLHEEGSLVPAPILAKLLQGVRALGTASTGNEARPDLSPTEIKILDQVKRGLQNKEIGALLNISEKTVRNHLNNAFLKLDVKTRTEAIVKAIQKGILTLEE